MKNYYSVTSNFQGGYKTISCESTIYDKCSVARYDVKGRETFADFVTEEQKEEIRQFAKSAGIIL